MNKLKLLIVFGLGALYCFPALAQKTKEKGVPKKLLPDPNYQKYLNAGVTKISPHAITFQLFDPIQLGSIGVGYQRKLHKRVMAEVNLGFGIRKIKSLYDGDYFIEPNNDQFNLATSESYKEKFSFQTQLIHNQFGHLVNHVWGYGIYYKYTSIGTKYAEQNVDNSTTNLNAFGIVFTTQTRLYQNLGLGFTLGGGYAYAKRKNIPYLPDPSNIDKKIRLITDKFITEDAIVQIKLTYIL